MRKTKISHSKYKNTGLLFELLVRQTTADVLNDSKKESVAIKLIKKYFGNKKSLSKELSLYKGLIESRFSSEDRAKDLINESIESRKKLSNLLIKKEKYNLIKEIKENYNIDEFFRNKLSNYKNFASIYKLFENAISEESELSPAEKVQCKSTLIEHIVRKQSSSEKPKEIGENEKALEEYKKMTEDLRLLTYKTMLDKFNEKYKELDSAQKNLLREYIYNVSDTSSFRNYVDNEVDKVKKEITILIPNIKDKATRIKVEGVVSDIDKLKKGKVVNENQLVQLMKYFQLSKEIKGAIEPKGVLKKSIHNKELKEKLNG